VTIQILYTYPADDADALLTLETGYLADLINAGFPETWTVISELEASEDGTHVTVMFIDPGVDSELYDVVELATELVAQSVDTSSALYDVSNSYSSLTDVSYAPVVTDENGDALTGTNAEEEEPSKDGAGTVVVIVLVVVLVLSALIFGGYKYYQKHVQDQTTGFDSPMEAELADPVLPADVEMQPKLVY
jgi:hypothetical protein